MRMYEYKRKASLSDLELTLTEAGIPFLSASIQGRHANNTSPWSKRPSTYQECHTEAPHLESLCLHMAWL